MQTCLGLYIEEHIIKYAKISKDNGNIKIDAFGLKFYDKVEEAIKQVIAETYSYKIPISINLSNEMYNYFQIFSLLNKKDIENVVNTEFESLCYEKNINKDTFESRYVLVNNQEDTERVKAIHVSTNKANLAKNIHLFDGNRLTTISPIGISIGNILDFKEKENAVIVNIEDNTTITTIIDKKIVDVQIIEQGADEILTKINIKENSYSKAYEICKNSTIYTNDGKDLQYEENEYLDDIMPTLYNIVGAVRKITSTSLQKIDKVYITGTASVINNIDIYFQEYLGDVKCEILRPYFIKTLDPKINIKDYIEVNSAIALSLQGMGEGIKAMNFKRKSLKDQMSVVLFSEVGAKNGKTGKSSNPIKMPKINMDLSGALTPLEMSLIRTGVGVILLMSVYGGFTIYLNAENTKKMEEINARTAQINQQIQMVKLDESRIKDNTSKYSTMIARLQELNNQASEKSRVKNAIPTLLNRVMFSIPKEVQITSIENTTGTHIVIRAQAEQYEKLAYFRSSLKNNGILSNVTSTNGEKSDTTSAAVVTIEGDLP